MAKLSCFYFFILMLVFSVVPKAKGFCYETTDPKDHCNNDDGVKCRLNCYEEYNGVGHCIKTKLGRDTCLCTYNCE
ncbi:unnamed protein product [Thlaspi arvense]|uniref:Defensin-like protein n=1 Tax=Thlaspi arvense TaxID=13288 RepID=A0AAU9R6S9_THLAR|nr:unnamed protein product [Thlaspi arvense]